MDEQEKTVEEGQEDKVLLAVKEEYENQIVEIKKAYEEEIKKIKEEAEERTIKQIKALMSGRTIEQQEPVEKELDPYETLLEETRAKIRR